MCCKVSISENINSFFLPNKPDSGRIFTQLVFENVNKINLGP